MTPPLCNSAMRRADNSCCRGAWPCAQHLVCVFTKTHHLMHICTNICLGCWAAFRLCFIDKSVSLKPARCRDTMCYAAAFHSNCVFFLFTAAFDLMKNVNRQAGYVTQCRMSRGLVIGLKTEPHCERDLTQTYVMFVLTVTWKNKFPAGQNVQVLVICHNFWD